MGKITQDEAIERIRTSLGDKYDLSKAVYVDTKTKMTVFCSVHGEFDKKPEMLWTGRGCEQCRHDKNVLPVEEWISRFRSVHGDLYDYSLITDLRHPKMATIICREHGEFQKQPHNHWTGGAGCPVCSKANLAPQSNHLSRDQWIARFKESHGDRYGYEKFVPAGGYGKAVFICPTHGEFEQDQTAHANGHIGCDGCKKDGAATKFLTDAKDRFEDRYDYTKFEYVNAKTKSIIFCPEHGEFMQNPDKHLTSKYPCPHCFSIGRRKVRNTKPNLPCPTRASLLRKVKATKPKGKHYPKVDKDEYLRRLNLPQGYSADLSEYKSLLRGPVSVTCPNHGVITHDDPRSFLLRSSACSTCANEYRHGKGKTKDYSEFIAEASAIHNDVYFYPECPDFVNRRSIVSIVCPTHGVFKKKAQKHLTGQGCPPCGLDDLRASGRLTGGYSMQLFDTNDALSNKPGTVYYLKVGSVYKIGITANDIRRRISAIKNVSKREVILIQSFQCTLREAYVLEQSVLKRFQEFRTFRNWSTEVFTQDVLSGLKISDIAPVTQDEMDD